MENQNVLIADEVRAITTGENLTDEQIQAILSTIKELSLLLYDLHVKGKV